MSVLLAALKLRNRFLPGYARRLAQSYEARRQGVRWRREKKAFAKLYARVAPASVLDCPVGTGRWLATYRKSGASVVGVDLSEHMLEEARQKVHPDADVRLVQGDALDPAILGDVGRGHDLIVCTRFLHWLPPRKVERLAESFAAAEPRYVLISAKVTPEPGAPPPDASASAGPGLPRRIVDRLRRNVVTHVHDEALLLGAFAAHGFVQLGREPVIEGAEFCTYLYLLGCG